MFFWIAGGHILIWVAEMLGISFCQPCEVQENEQWDLFTRQLLVVSTWNYTSSGWLIHWGPNQRLQFWLSLKNIVFVCDSCKGCETDAVVMLRRKLQSFVRILVVFPCFTVSVVFVWMSQSRFGNYWNGIRNRYLHPYSAGGFKHDLSLFPSFWMVITHGFHMFSVIDTTNQLSVGSSPLFTIFFDGKITMFDR